MRLFAMLGAAVLAAAPAFADLQADLDRMMAWFPGQYDNHTQVYQQWVDKVPDDLKHRQTHHIFHPVSVPGIPGPSLYAQQSEHYDRANLYRQRIYAFSIDAAEQAIKLTIYTPKDPSQLTDAHLDPAKLERLSAAEDFILKPGCEVYWTFDGTQYNGYLKQNACSYVSTRYDMRIYLNETLTLRRDALLLHDKALDEAGNLVFGAADKGPTVNLKQVPCETP